ncbi:MAG: hypothetical protein ACSW8K_01990 [bacterium]
MKNKRRNSGSQRPLGRFLYSAVTVFLLLIFLTAMAGGIFRIRDRLSSDEYDYYDEASYLNRLRNEDYAGLLEMTRDDSRADKVYKGDIPECRAVAMYYDAAVFFHAYEKAGDAENAARQKERMDKFEQEAGSYAYYTDKIDALFEGYQ